VNIRQDPFERFPMIAGESALTGAFGYGNDFYAREFWRFVLVQQRVADLAKTASNSRRCRTRRPSTWTQ